MGRWPCPQWPSLVTSGQIAHGQPTPTIANLAAKHGTTRVTAGKALRLLAEEGLLIRCPGLGYFVTGPEPK